MRRNLLLVGIATVVCASWAVLAQGPAAPAPDPSAVPTPMPPGPTPPATAQPKQSADASGGLPDIPADMRDPAFERFVNLWDLAGDWLALDSPALADCGLQLAEGERVLLRQHRAGFSSVYVLQLAARAAAVKRDRPTLERVKKYGDENKVPVLTKLAEEGLKGLEAEDPDAALLRVSADDMSVRQFAAFKGAVNVLRHARLDRDADRLASLEKLLPTLHLPELQNRELRAAIAASRGEAAKRYTRGTYGGGAPPMSPINRLLRAGGCNTPDCGRQVIAPCDRPDCGRQAVVPCDTPDCR